MLIVLSVDMPLLFAKCNLEKSLGGVTLFFLSILSRSIFYHFRCGGWKNILDGSRPRLIKEIEGLIVCVYNVNYRINNSVTHY